MFGNAPDAMLIENRSKIKLKPEIQAQSPPTPVIFMATGTARLSLSFQLLQDCGGFEVDILQWKVLRHMESDFCFHHLDLSRDF